jgi:hypothetical protein
MKQIIHTELLEIFSHIGTEKGDAKDTVLGEFADKRLTLNGMPVFCRGLEIQRLPSSSVIISFQVRFFKSIFYRILHRSQRVTDKKRNVCFFMPIKDAGV